MFGTYRTILALLVVAAHIGKFNFGGIFAVFGFYALSGYLMTLIVHRTYGYSAYGFGAYALNRFLRIYPLYWISALTSLACIALFGQQLSTSYHAAIYIPDSVVAALKNIFLVMFPTEHSPRLTPPAWALTVELFYYVLIGLGLSRTKLTTWAWFLAASSYHGIMILTNGRLSDIYFAIPAAALPFSAGALIFHHAQHIKAIFAPQNRVKTQATILLVTTALLSNLLVFELSDSNFYFHFYANFLLTALMVCPLISAQSVLFVRGPLDQWIGDLSYPIYLIHYQVGMLVVGIGGALGLGITRPSFLLLALALPIVLIVAVFFSRFIERRIEKWRKTVKHLTAKKSLQRTAVPAPVLPPHNRPHLKRR